MGLNYRNRVAKFIKQMSVEPTRLIDYKSNPHIRGTCGSSEQDQPKLTAFAFDPAMTTRTGRVSDFLATSVMRTGSISKHVSYEIAH